jgi:hypothetical protein
MLCLFTVPKDNERVLRPPQAGPSLVQESRLKILEVGVSLQQLLHEGKSLRIGAGNEVAVTLALAFLAKIIFVQRGPTGTDRLHDQLSILPPGDKVILLVLLQDLSGYGHRGIAPSLKIDEQ